MTIAIATIVTLVWLTLVVGLLCMLKTGASIRRRGDDAARREFGPWS